jgi:hypothetical protein
MKFQAMNFYQPEQNRCWLPAFRAKSFTVLLRVRFFRLKELVTAVIVL